MALAASYEAKAFGVRGGMSGREARELCPQLIFVSGHFSDTSASETRPSPSSATSRRWWSGFSIDEPSPTSPVTHLFGSPPEIAATIRQRVWTSSVFHLGRRGADQAPGQDRLASRQAGRLVVVDQATELEFRHDLPIELMWGVVPSPAELRSRASSRSYSWRTRRTARSSVCSATTPTRISTRSPGTAIRRESTRTLRDPLARSLRSEGPLERVFAVLLHLGDRIASRLRARTATGEASRCEFASRHARRDAVRDLDRSATTISRDRGAGRARSRLGGEDLRCSRLGRPLSDAAAA